jgi:hypothetical protein
MSRKTGNPFSVKTPETMSAQEVVDLFVPIGDYYDIENSGHVFVHGHRGCGKSMMFRLMSPDCQSIKLNSDIKSLPYYGVYLSIKATDLNIPEFQRLDGHIAGFILSEHVLVGYLIVKTIQSVCDNLEDILKGQEHLEEIKGFCERSIIDRLKLLGWSGNVDVIKSAASGEEALSHVVDIFNANHALAIQYLKRLTFIQTIIPYDGVLLGFQDFFLPLLKDLKRLSFMPRGPIYLLLDDADNLNLQQQQVLNTWVSYRTTADLSLKISTQLNYQTYLTTSGQRIEYPHDYTDIYVSGIHTGPAKDKYPKWVADIVGKRLALFDIQTSPQDFFPEDKKQEDAIAAIADEIKANWSAEGSGGFRPRDDAYRYARPEYMKRLSGTSKQGSSYKYAGFDQLVHISAGIIRFFLEPASKMFSEEQKNSDGGVVKAISPSVQDKIVREASDEILFSEFDKLIEDIDKSFNKAPDTTLKMRKLRNLIYSIGGLFHEILLSDRSERRVFSFAISDQPDKEIREVLRLGVQYGYFYLSAIGTKEGMGRTRLYVLNRRLAPFFKLDPMGFTGYQFITNSFLRKAIEKPKTTQNRLRRHGVDAVLNEEQQTFEFEEDADES